MRLLVLSQYFWPENFRVNDLVAELVARGHEVTVLTTRPNYPGGQVFEEYRREPQRFASYAGARIVRVPAVVRGRGGLRLALNYLSFAASASLLGAWRLRGRPFDAILAYQVSPVTIGIPGAVLRRLKRAPLAFWVLDLWPDTLAAIGVLRSAAALRAVGRLVNFIYRRCDLILAQSRSYIPHIARRCRADARIVYFPGWSELTFAPQGVGPAPEVPQRAGSFNVMFAGNIGEAQDFPTILDAAERLRGNSRIRWLLLGGGRMADWVQSEIQRRGLVESVLMLGSYPMERMPSFYAHAQALLVTLKNEPIFAMTIPGKLQSYLAAGVPVVAALAGEGAEVVASAGAGVACPPGDAAALADAVLGLSRLPAESLAQMGRNARAVSEQEFDRATLISRLEDWLKHLQWRARRA